MNSSSPQYLFLPIETKNREFHGKLLLSCAAAEAGFRVILCEQQELRRQVHRFSPGLYLDKSVVTTKARMFRDYRALGHRVVAWCEEGFTYPSPETYLRQRIAPETFAYLDWFFTWGAIQAEHVATKIPDAPVRMTPTGNPRFDLLRKPFRALYEPEAERLRRQHGPFVLINTSFLRYNHFHSLEYLLERLKKRHRVNTPEEEQFYWDWSAYTGRMFHAFVEMTRELSRRMPEVTFIVRPHPSENHDRWRQETASLANVKVYHEGPAVPWIMASRVLVHNTCTTGVEAFLLEKPVVAYMPITSNTFDDPLPNGISLQATSLDRLVDVVRKIVDTGVEPNEENRAVREALARRYVANMDGEFACDRIVKMLTHVTNMSPRRLPGDSGVGTAMARWSRPLRQAWAGFRRKLRGMKSYSKQKFPGLTIVEVEEAMAALRRVSGRFAGVGAVPVPGMQNGFELSQRK